MYIRPIRYQSFKKYGHTIRSTDNLTQLYSYDYALINCRDGTEDVVFAYENPVYIEPASGIGVLVVLYDDSPEIFLFARPVCINPDVEFCVLPYDCDFSYYIYSSGIHAERPFNAHALVRSNRTRLSINRIYTFLYMEENKNFVFKGERHPYWELMYVDIGELTAVVSGEKYQLKQGEMIIYRPNEFHAIHANKKSMVSFLNIAFDLQAEGDVIKRRIYHIDKDVRDLLRIMISESQRQDEYSVDFMEANLKLLLLRLIRGEVAPQENAAVPSEEFVINRKEIVHRAKQLITQGLSHGDCSVAEIARQLNISTSHLYRIFKEFTGDSVQTFIINERFSLAKEMIALGSMNISQISARLDFCSPTYFSTKFKDRFGMTPREYSRSVYRK